jgi:hypothetical protein
VANNHVAAGSTGGIDCGSANLNAPKNILDSIVFGNDGMQLGPTCMTTNVVSSGTVVLTADGKLQAGTPANTACCVDKVAKPDTPNSDHDFDNAHRPQGMTGKWTIGANELAQ